MNHWVIVPVLLPLFTAVILLAFAQQELALRRAFSVVSTVVLLLVSVMLWTQVEGGQRFVYALGNWPAPYGIVLVLDRLSAFMLVLTSVLAVGSVLYALGGTDGRGRSYHTLFHLQLLGINGAFLTGDVFNLFVFFEVLLIASYGLLLHGKGAERSRAGFKYVVLNLVGSAVFLIALGILYGTLGTLNLADIADRVQALRVDRIPMVYVGALLLFAVFALKAGMVLLHFWLPSAYASAAPPVAALFAIMTKVGVYAIVRVFGVAFPEGPVADWMADWVTPLGLATLLAGSLGMLASHRLGQIIAYQVVASVGTLLAVAGIGTEAAYAAAFYYLAHSTIATGLLFLVGGLITEARGEAGDHMHVGPVMNQAGLLALLFIIGTASMVGLPPFSGFIGKVLALEAAQHSRHVFWIWLVILAGGLFNLISWSRVGSLLFWKSAPTSERLSTPPAHPAAWSGVAAMTVAALGLIVLAGPLTEVSSALAQQIVDPAGYVADVLTAPVVESPDASAHAQEGGH